MPHGRLYLGMNRFRQIYLVVSIMQAESENMYGRIAL